MAQNPSETYNPTRAHRMETALASSVSKIQQDRAEVRWGMKGAGAGSPLYPKTP